MKEAVKATKTMVPMSDEDIATLQRSGRSIEGFMPPYKEIPEEFHNNHNKWNKLFSDWFFMGLPPGTEFIPNEGVDKDKALRHIRSIMRSWDPKHEHKEAAVAYLLSLWFKEVKLGVKP